jgi:hypothetical protein
MYCYVMELLPLLTIHFNLFSNIYEGSRIGQLHKFMFGYSFFLLLPNYDLIFNYQISFQNDKLLYLLIHYIYFV